MATGAPEQNHPATTKHANPLISFAARHPWSMPLLALVLLLGIVAGAIIIRSVSEQRVSLDDGTVWVTSLKDRKAARFNVKLREADAAVSSTANSFDVAQHDADTIISEGAQATSISASSVTVDGKTPISTDISTYVGADTLAFLDTKTGDVWFGRSTDVNSITPASSKPGMRLGAGGKIAVNADGTIYGYRPADSMVLSVDNPQSGSPREIASLNEGTKLEVDDFTVVGDKPVIAYDGTIAWGSGSASTDATGRLMLQSPPADNNQSDWVAASGNGTLYAASLSQSTDKAVSINSGGSGEPAKPVSMNGCVFGAWAQTEHNYAHVCSLDQANTEANQTDLKTLESISPTSDMVFRTNHRKVILNDVANGNVWDPERDTAAIKIQWQTLQSAQTTDQNSSDDSANNQREFSKTCSSKSGQIKANADEFTARVGSQLILDVLRNDEQTDCSVLQISSVGAVAGSDVDVAAIYSGRYIQLDATKAKPGQATFNYEISDGRGQTSSATVTLSIEGSEENAAPRQTDVPPEYDVEQGATFTNNALGSFTDPDGDPMTLVGAKATNSDQVAITTRADGQLVFNAGSMVNGRVAVDVTVSDGEETGTGTIYFSIRPADTLAPLLDPVVKQTIAKKETLVDLKSYVHGTSAEPVSLTSVESPTGATTSMDSTDLAFSFTAAGTGTYYVPYTISQGSSTATGLVRVEVQALTTQAAKPVAANDIALIGANNTAIVEPLNNDVDPLGGVLSLTDIQVDPALGIKAGIVGHHRVYLTAMQIPTKPVTLHYTVTNEAGSTQGSILLQPPSLSVSNSAPKATNINTQVRTGGIVSINVLDHVSYSDGTTVTLNNDLQYDEHTFQGLAFVSDDTVRYQAGDTPGVYPVTYTVSDDLGNSASGIITITVHERDAENKPAPKPKTAEVQVAAGHKVRIPITMTGIDVDGDDDMLLGLGNTAPTLGRISEVGADYMIYEAYADSQGTDTFTYAVEDWIGQRAQAQIRVGVFTDNSAHGVYARDDSVTLRTNTETSVPVTDNDIAENDSELTLDPKLEQQGIEGAKVSGNTIEFTTPSQATTGYIVYTVRDEAGFTDTATLNVTVDPNAPISPPKVQDYRVPAAATIDLRSVDVDVSASISNPSGTTNELIVNIDPSARDHARIKGSAQSRIITVDLTDEARAIPYTVTNTTYNLTSTAFIEVPAYGVFPPLLRPKAPELKVNEGETITIDIADYVRVGAGKTATVESKDSVSATKAGNDKLYVDDHTLSFTAPTDYAGPASISFSVCDGKASQSKKVRINCAMLTLRITVIGIDSPPPSFSSTTIDVVAGEPAVNIDLRALTHSTLLGYDDNQDYVYSGSLSTENVTASITSAGMLSASATLDAKIGTVARIPITITYDSGTLQAGLSIRVVQSNRPLARVASQAITVKAGSTEHVNLFSGAYNPFPDTPLKAVDCVSADDSKLTIGCDASGDITISAASNIGVSSNKVLVTVADGTNAKDRQVSAAITVSVIDKPDAPLLSPVAGKPADSSVNLTWTPGNANGSPITEYQVLWDGGNEQSCGNVTTCQITGLTNGKSYSFTVKAKNEVGWSDSSQAVTAMPDKVPDPPRDIKVEPGHLQATVSWSQPDYVGTPPDSYTVTLTGSNGWSKTQIADALQSTFTIENGSISDGTTFYATVQGRNRAGEGPVSAASRAEQVWGNPDAPTVNATQQGDDHISVDVTPGNLHNAGCSTIVISGGLMGTIDCTQKTITFNISSNQYWNQLTIKATLFAEKLSASSSSATTTITPSYSIPAASVVSLGLEGTDNVCTFRWNPKGHVDGFQVEGNGKSVTLGGQVRSWQYQIVPWTTCGTATVRQKLNSKVSTQSASLISNDTYQAQATVSLPTKVSWSRKGTDTVHIEKVGGHVDTYNISANKTFEIIFDDGTSDESDWIEGTTSFDISTQTEKVPTQWRIVVTATNPENQRLDTSSTGSVIETSALQTSSAIKPAENLSTSVFQSARQCGTLTNPCRSEVSAAAKTQTKESN